MTARQLGKAMSTPEPPQTPELVVAVPPAERKYWFMTASAWMTLIFGSLFTAIAGLTVASTSGWLNTKEPHLRQSVPNAISFESEKNPLSIFNFTIENDGSKEAEQVYCRVSIPGAEIREANVQPHSLRANVKPIDKTKQDVLEFDVASLNPTDVIQVSLLVANVDRSNVSPQVEVKGKGVNGVLTAKKPTSEQYWINLAFWAISLGLLSLSINLALSDRSFRKFQLYQMNTNNYTLREIIDLGNHVTEMNRGIMEIINDTLPIVNETALTVPKLASEVDNLIAASKSVSSKPTKKKAKLISDRPLAATPIESKEDGSEGAHPSDHPPTLSG
jgi:hypothetical protein